MNDMFSNLYHAHLEPYIYAGLLVILGIVFARLLSTAINKTLLKHMTPQQSMLIKRIVFYFVLALFVASAFEQLGFHISTLLGAAGILTVAIGIASQTSMSNVVSGIFMIGEKPFEIGDYIQLNNTIGEILSIDLLSVRMRTQDNTMVRIPNELLIKSIVVNLSYFPIRRLDIKIGIAYKEDLEKVKKILFDLATKNPLSLIDPKPQMQTLGFGESSINIQFSVWAARAHYTELKNTIFREIQVAFADEKIEMPYPSHSLFTGVGTDPFPVKII